MKELIREESAVRGVRYPTPDGWGEVRALLTVGADGRFSKLRRLAGLKPVKTSPPMDVLWFKVPREARDPEGALGRFGAGGVLILLDRLEQWQVGYVIPKGSYQALRAAGMEALRDRLAALAPELAGRLDHLRVWSDISLLQVESDHLRRWYLPGLLLIGDAAHVMSPVGGVGINYAIHDAVVTANLLAPSLAAGRVPVADLRSVQRARARPTRLIQAFQTFIQRRVIAGALTSTGPVRIPALLRLTLRMSFLRDLPARVAAFGFGRPHVRL